jgi:hypothetical protein
MLENYALPQFNNSNNNNHFNWTVRLSILLTISVTEREFPRSVDRKRRTSAWPPRSPDLTPLDLFLWGSGKDQEYSQGVNTQDELREQITAAIANAAEDVTAR